MGDGKYRRILWIFLAAAALVRLACILNFELLYDEAFYWMCSRHLAFSYLINPPLIGIIIRFFTLPGNTEFLVRTGSLLSWAGTMYLLYLTARDIYGARAGLLTVLITSFIPLYIPVGFIMTPDMPFLLFWVWSIYLLRRVFSGEGENSRLWYFAGITAGLGMLTKHHMVLLFPPVFLYMLLSGKNRKWLSRREPYIAALISLVFFSPVVIWNAANDFVSFTFQLAGRHGMESAPVIPDTLLFFFASQAVVLTPVIFMLVLAVTARAFYLGIKKKDDPALYLSTFTVFIFLFFALWSIKTKVKPHWMACGYIPAMMLFAGMIEQTFTAQAAKTGKILLSAVFAVTFLPILVTLALVFMTVTDTLEYAPLPKAVSTYLHSRFDFVPDQWRRTGSAVAGVRKNMPGAGDPFIFSAGEYRIPSLAAFYSRQPYNTYLMDASGDSVQYDMWQDLDSLEGRNAVFIGKKRHADAFDFGRYFHRIEQDSPVEFRIGGRLSDTLYIYRCYGYKGINK